MLVSHSSNVLAFHEAGHNTASTLAPSDAFTTVASLTSNSTPGFHAAGITTGSTPPIGDGGHIADLALLGQYTAGNFGLSSDGHGATYITDPAHVGSSASPVLAAHG